MAYRYKRSNVSAPTAEVTSLWTIWWDMRRRAGTEGRSRATEPTQDEALQRTERFLKSGSTMSATSQLGGRTRKFGLCLHDAAADF